MRGRMKDRVEDDLQAFCEDAARQMVGIEMRLRTLTAMRQEPAVSLIEEAIGCSLQYEPWVSGLRANRAISR